MSHQPSELPSTRRLLKATVAAAAIAAVILVTAVLPAEYGIDPTGIGSRLGLEALANADAAELPAEAPADPALDAVGQPVKPVQDEVVHRQAGTFRDDSMAITLPPGKGAEIKAALKAGDGFVFHWSSSGDVAVDMHGEATDAVDDAYTSYWIERSQRLGSGSFTAPFDGTHGWYWLNRGTEPVTVKVEVSGFQQSLFRPGQQ